MEGRIPNRIAKWDNVKGILILLVVIGHFADAYCESFGTARALFTLIYAFHMPAFFFVSGLFSKKNANRPTFAWRAYAPLLVLFFVLDVIRFFTSKVNNPELTLKIARMNNVSWFMFVLFMCYVLVHLFRNVKPQYVLSVAIFISVFIGYSDEFGSLFSIYRLAHVFPFFYLGYMIDPDELLERLDKISIKVAGGLVLAIWGVFCFMKTDYLYEYRRLLTGANSYSELSFGKSIFAGLAGVVYILIVLVLVTAFISVIPKNEMILFAKSGRASLSIYFWHLIIIGILNKLPVFGNMISTHIGMIVSFLVMSLIIIWVLSLRVFVKPIEWLRNPPMLDGEGR